MNTPVAAPRARPAASGVSVVLGLALVGVAVVAVHDLAVDRGWASGQSWIGTVVDRLDGLRADVPVLVAGIVAAVVGLWLVWLAVKPAAPTHDTTPGEADVWITPRAVRALAAGAAESTPGVAAATARGRRGRLVVTVQSDRPDISSLVESSVTTALDGLGSSRSVAVKTEKVKHDS